MPYCCSSTISVQCFHRTLAANLIIGAVAGAAAGAVLIPIIAPSVGIAAASKFPPQAEVVS